MLTVTSAVRTLIDAGRVPDFRAVFTYAGGTNETLNASRFLSGSPVIKLGVSADGEFTVGGAVIGSFNFSLINDDGHFDSVDFSGSRIVPQVGYNNTWYSLGTYHMVSHKSARSVIACTAYDSLALLDDAEFNATWPVTFLAAAQAICTNHGLTLASTSFTGANMEFADPEELMTERMVLSYMAQCTGNHVRMNAAGQMVIERATGGSKAISSVFDANLQTSSIEYTGVMITPYGKDTPSLYGNAGNMLMITENPLITEENVDNVGQMLWDGYITAVNAAGYTAGSADILSDFTIEPGDVLTIMGKSFLVTNLTYKLGVRESVACDAEDRVSNDLRKSNTEIFAAGIASSKEIAMSAQEAAVVANNAATNALLQLSVVEDVAGTLAWIQEHGSYVATTDTSVQSGTIYFELISGQYVPIANPDPGANPQSEGWYVLDVSDSQAQYIMAHLAVTSAGLWVLPAGSFSSHEIVDANGRILVDAQGNPVISWQTDPQNADGYKVLLSNAGMVVFNGAGEAVASYGPTTTIGSSTGKNVHIDSESVLIRNGSEVLASFGADGAEFGKDTDESTTATDRTGLYVKYKVTNEAGEEFSVPVVVLKPQYAGDPFVIPIISATYTGDGASKRYSTRYVSDSPDKYLDVTDPERRVFAVLIDGEQSDAYSIDAYYDEETPESSRFMIVFDTAPAAGSEIQIVVYATPTDIILHKLTPFYPDTYYNVPASVFAETVAFLQSVRIGDELWLGEKMILPEYANDSLEFGTLRIPGIATAAGAVYATLILDKPVDPAASVSITYTGGYIRGAGASISGATITASVDSGGHALEILASKASSFTQYQTYMIVLTGVSITFS